MNPGRHFRKLLAVWPALLVTLSLSAQAAPANPQRGLSDQARQELSDAGMTKYLGAFSPALDADVGGGWTKHTFDAAGGDGPLCIAGTPYSVFTREANPAKLLVMLQGGGACWQDFYYCNILAEAQEPRPGLSGIWDFDAPGNPFADYSIVYMPYCDGSTFIGDNDVVDPAFPYGPVRFHRGLRNMSAGLDLARHTFPHASRITVAGSSAGGVGAAAFTPLLTRLLYGDNVHLTVFNDAGPVAINLNESAAIAAREADWRFGQFLPGSCSDCDPLGQSAALIQWRLENDATIREAFYSTDGDATNRFFLNVPSQSLYRDLLLSVHGAIEASYPGRYKRFIVSGDATHTALQSPLFYAQEVDGVPLNEWTSHFVKPVKPFWMDLVESFIPLLP